MSAVARKTAVVVWGASGHARVVADILRLMGRYRIRGFIDDVNASRRGEAFCGARVLGGQEQLDALLENGFRHMILAFGDCRQRLRLAEFASKKGFTLVTAVHPRATVAGDARLGAGTVVAAGAVVNPAARIGKVVIVNTSASVDHECEIEDGAHIAPGARLAARVSVGRGAWVGIGAAIKEGVRIGSGAVVGAGSVVLEDIAPDVVAYGAPARTVRPTGI
ncbi:MAG TPA: sugar acetyltransferase [Elusimicrobia bacterium]|nr:sugar acetyltransferase [Elusimicrobiota bacterium]HBT61924.1 sugar acetyltransferase [Elusimicrobiota bacterium]